MVVQPTKQSPNHEISIRSTVWRQFPFIFHSVITYSSISSLLIQQHKNEWISSNIQNDIDPSSTTLAHEMFHLNTDNTIIKIPTNMRLPALRRIVLVQN